VSGENALQLLLDEALAERARLWHELNLRIAHERELEDCHAELDQLRAALSWRITAPLRRCQTLAGRAQRSLRR
jgi:hypothetical protein